MVPAVITETASLVSKVHDELIFLLIKIFKANRGKNESQMTSIKMEKR